MKQKKWNNIIAEIMATLIIVSGTAVIIAAAIKAILWLLG